MLRKWCIQHKYSVIFIAFLICFYGYSISRVYGFIFFPDEFGYWAYAAKAAGYDWSEIVSLGSYYSYGYSLILFPIFKLCRDSVMAYRTAVTLNFILLGAVFFMMLFLAKRLLKEQQKERIPFYVAVAVLYPTWLFYAQTTMVETALMTTFVFITILLYNYLEKNKMSTLVLLVVALVYIHFLHMRAIGVLIAGIVTLITYFLLQKRMGKQFLIFMVIGIVILLGGFAIKGFVQGGLYGSAATDTLNINDYAGQFEKMVYIFSRDGFVDLLCGLAGKILYLGLASFGLAYWGIWYAAKETVNLLKKGIRGEKCVDGRLLYLFILLATVGETLINTIYNIRPGRVDSVTYGRYHEFILPIVMLLGIYEMTKTKKLLWGTIVIAVIQLPLVPMVLYMIQKYQLTNIHGYFMVGISYLHYLKEFEPNSFFWTTYGFLIVLTVLTACMVALSKRKGRELILVFLLVMEFLLSVRASNVYLDSSSLGAYRDTYIVDKIETLKRDNTDRRIVYIREDDSPFVSIMQFMMRDEEISMIPCRAHIEEYTREEMDADDIIMLKYDSDYTEEIEKQYTNHLLYGHFVIYYN